MFNFGWLWFHCVLDLADVEATARAAASGATTAARETAASGGAGGDSEKAFGSGET